MAIRAETCSWDIYVSDNIVVFKTVYPRTVVYLWLTNTTRMTHLEDDNASRGSIRRHKNLKRKLYNCKAKIYFNDQCLRRWLTPSYARIRIPNNSPAHKHTQQKVTNIGTRDEIKYLHSKKQQLNLQLYQLHLYLAHTWDKTWSHILRTLKEKLQRKKPDKIQDLRQKTRKPLSYSNTNTTRKTHIPPQSCQ